MRKLLWPIRIGIVTLALVSMPAEAGDGRLSQAALCAAQTADGDCKEEAGSYCEIGGTFYPDLASKS